MKRALAILVMLLLGCTAVETISDGDQTIPEESIPKEVLDVQNVPKPVDDYSDIQTAQNDFDAIDEALNVLE